MIARLAVLAVTLALGACAGLPSLEGRAESRALADTQGTRLGRAAAPHTAAHPGRSGIHALGDPVDAFAARAVLAATAERSLDVQYYIWHGDQSGYLLLEALRQAAERGVRVRLLLDDNNTRGLDATLAALDAHPNIEVRLYNPVVHRGFRALNFVTDFSRANRRMHNKSFTADNQVAIVGGRNIGNEYFGVGPGVVFADLDVLAVGPVVAEVSGSFDRYWNSASAYPAALFVGAATPESTAALAERVAAARADPQAARYLDALRRSASVSDLLRGELRFEWAVARVVDDDPAKTRGATATKDTLLLSQLLPLVGQPRRSFDLISPYFVPGEEGTAALVELAHRGVTVRVLTNSLAATDVAAVHAGYAKRREALLRAGVQLWELKPSISPAGVDGARGAGGSSSASLHAKTFAMDDARVFVGSFNFDPRSALLNTELGVIIESPALAERFSAAFTADVPRNAYRVRLAPAGGLEWVEHTEAGEVVHATEPRTTALQRTGVWFMSILPIEGLL